MLLLRCIMGQGVNSMQIAKGENATNRVKNVLCIGSLVSMHMHAHIKADPQSLH